MNEEHNIGTAEEDDRVRSLRRVTALDDWPTTNNPVAPVRTIAVLDVETDGLDPQSDNVIEIAIALVDVDAAGRIVTIGDLALVRQDPGRLIPPRISQLTGLTNADLARKGVNTSALAAFINRAEAICAHNSRFDRGFCERMMPDIKPLPWLCSMNDVPWQRLGYDGAKLGHLLMQNGLFAPRAHNAGDDVIALLNLLSCRLPGGKTVIGEAMANAQMRTVRIDAFQAPFRVKDELKRFGYRFDWRQKVWWIEVGQDEVERELAWLKETAPFAEPRQTTITWHERYR
ncbi:3'-5' exonuclease [Novosphingopyxis sp.]|uniref:3'-5' exonuclease n=1 Tax=Novosphingopyxis sp. TaxID=2709690 RepID=UPI003B5C21BE